MNVSTQLLICNALAICTYSLTKSLTIISGIQPTGVVTMAMDMLYHISGFIGESNIWQFVCWHHFNLVKWEIN